MPKTRCRLRLCSLGRISFFSCLIVVGCVNRFACADPPETPTRKLIEKLREQNTGNDRYKEPWCQTLKQIADLGPEAVPDLIEELDETENEMMMRCLGFILRAIGDPRAVPALIRSLPKTLIRPSSDMGLTSNDPEFIKFAQAHDLNHEDVENEFDFGRPVREICGALQKLTNHEQNEQELYHVFLVGLPSQQQLKRELFQRRSMAWAEWWETNWSKYTKDEAYSRVNLVIPEDNGGIEPPPLDGHFRSTMGGSNWMLESVFDPRAKRVFYDLDVGRVGAVPEKWRGPENVEAHFDEIVKWALREGFDLMGSEYDLPDQSKVYALRSLGMRVWELDPSRWKAGFNRVTIEELQNEGRPAEKYLLHRDMASNAIKPLEKAPFFYITRHGTPGLLFVGIPVTVDSLKPGGRFQGDNELNPINFNKGRRFAFSNFEQVDR